MAVERLCTTCGKPIKPEAKTRNAHRCLCEENQSEAQKKLSGGNQAGEKKKLANGLDPSIGAKTQFQPGQSGNPAGKPKGTISLSSHIQRMLNDESFELFLSHPREGYKRHEGVPVEAIIRTAVMKAAGGDTRWADWLAKYGYGTKVELTGPEGGPVQALVEFIGDAEHGKDSSTS